MSVGVEASNRARLRRVGQRLGLIVVGLVFGVAVLEATLQIGALLVGFSGASSPAAWVTGKRRVLCVGDSNTYGLYLADRAQAYPQQLERLWNAVPTRTPIEVLNLGYPGTNSSRLVRDLPRMLRILRPDVVIVMVGSNDFWTAPVHSDPSSGMAEQIVQLVERYSRVYQLIHMLGRAFDHRTLEVSYPVQIDGGSAGTARFGDVEFALGWTPGPRRGAEAYPELETNLRALAAIVRAAGSEPIFVTYGSGMWNYGDANRAIRSASAASAVRLVDAAVPIASVCPREPCPDYLFADHHPTGRGYEVIAGAIVRSLDEERQ